MEHYPRFEDVVFHLAKPKVVTVDMPIGLLSHRRAGGRVCDQEARKVLRYRASSIFSPPIRNQLSATSYEQVRTQGLSRQAFHLLPKIKEIDQFINPRLQQKVFEAHPELAFAELSGLAMKWNKKTKEGRYERLCALTQSRVWPFSILSKQLKRIIQPFSKKILAFDDALDAWGLAWTAYRIYLKKGVRVPHRPPKDQQGLRMEIWY